MNSQPSSGVGEGEPVKAPEVLPLDETGEGKAEPFVRQCCNETEFVVYWKEC